MSGTLFIELHYLPCIQYFAYLNAYHCVLIADDDVYSKQTYRNRCRIRGANKVENLIVPVKKKSQIKMLAKDVEIDYHQKWLNKHLRAIRSAYGKAPYFEYYYDELVEVYYKKPKHLFQLNKELLTKCLEILELNFDIEFTSKGKALQKNEVIDATGEITPKNPTKNSSIFNAVSYFQIFGNNFVENLSIIDLIFCEGPQSRHIIEKSCALE